LDKYKSKIAYIAQSTIANFQPGREKEYQEISIPRMQAEFGKLFIEIHEDQTITPEQKQTLFKEINGLQASLSQGGQNKQNERGPEKGHAQGIPQPLPEMGMMMPVFPQQAPVQNITNNFINIGDISKIPPEILDKILEVAKPAPTQTAPTMPFTMPGMVPPPMMMQQGMGMPMPGFGQMHPEPEPEKSKRQIGFIGFQTGANKANTEMSIEELKEAERLTLEKLEKIKQQIQEKSKDEAQK